MRRALPACLPLPRAAGHTVPLLAKAVLEHNSQQPTGGPGEIPLKGIAVGNPWVHPEWDNMGAPPAVASCAALMLMLLLLLFLLLLPCCAGAAAGQRHAPYCITWCAPPAWHMHAAPHRRSRCPTCCPSWPRTLRSRGEWLVQ